MITSCKQSAWGICNNQFCFSASGPHNINKQEQNIPQIPGPQVPPRLLERQQDKVLSVSGKKKCSHCKEELGKLNQEHLNEK